jgi:hypothetical protein
MTPGRPLLPEPHRIPANDGRGQSSPTEVHP